MQRANEGVLIAAHDLRILEANECALRMYGATRDEMMSLTLRDLFEPTGLARLGEAAVAENGIVFESHNRRRDGSTFPVEVSARHVDPEADGDRIVLVRDISERVRVAEELRQSREKLEQERNSLAERVRERTADLVRLNTDLAHALRTKDEFLATMSHELRTPLNAILGISEALIDQIRGPLNERQTASLTTIQASGKHLLALITEILDYSKAEAGQLTLNVTSVDPGRICRNAIELVAPLAAKKRQTIELADVPPGTIRADATRIEQMLANLLSNAVKFTPEEGSIRVDVVRDAAAGEVRISVKDTGIGISDADQARIFRPFVQLDAGLTRRYEGTGLGLTLVSRLAQLHGGSISVESSPGEGSRFTIVLPWAPASDAPDEAQAHASCAAPGDARTLRILLADDGEFNIAAIGEYLEDLGYEVVVARNGIQAIELAQRTRPDLILMDVQMPEMDGLEAMHRLRQEPAFTSTPIVAITGLAMSGDRERCLAAGANEYLAKPVSPKVLMETITSLLGAPAPC
jgi:PAS domain S-box-containing protein